MPLLKDQVCLWFTVNDEVKDVPNHSMPIIIMHYFHYSQSFILQVLSYISHYMCAQNIKDWLSPYFLYARRQLKNKNKHFSWGLSLEREFENRKRLNTLRVITIIILWGEVKLPTLFLLRLHERTQLWCVAAAVPLKSTHLRTRRLLDTWHARHTQRISASSVPSPRGGSSWRPADQI